MTSYSQKADVSTSDALVSGVEAECYDDVSKTGSAVEATLGKIFCYTVIYELYTVIYE